MKGVSQEGGIAAGHALLQVKTAEGGDICFAAYRPSRHQIGGLDTDAMQAFVGRRGTEISVLYLGGGTTLKVDNVAITRNEAGLAYVEHLQSDAWAVGNPSPVDGVVGLVFPALTGLDAFLLDDQDRRIGPAAVDREPATQTIYVHLKAGAKTEFAAKR